MLLRGFAAVAAVVGVLSVVGCDKPEAKKESAGAEAAKSAGPGEKAFLKLSCSAEILKAMIRRGS